MTQNVAAMMHRHAARVFQQAWVVNDIDDGIAAMKNTLGCGDFVKIPLGRMPWIVHGEEAICDMTLAFGRSGNTQIELMQPISGPGCVSEFAARFGAGPHHIGCTVDDFDHAIALAAADGIEAVMIGGFGPVRTAWLDTFDEIGQYFEFIHDPKGLLVKTMPWRDEQLDGGAR